MEADVSLMPNGRYSEKHDRGQNREIGDGSQ